MRAERYLGAFERFGISWLIFFFLCSVYLITTQGYIQSSDGMSSYLVTRSIVERGNLSIGEERKGLGVEGPDGKYYSKFGIGLSFAAVPLYYLGKISAPFLQMDGDFVTIFSCSLLNVFIVALTGALIFQLGVLFGFEKCTAITLSIIYGLGSLAWFYSSVFYSQPLVSLLIVLALILSIKWRSVWYGSLLAGFSLGCAVITRYETIILLPVFFLYIVFMGMKEKRRTKDIILKLALLSLPFLFFVGLVLEYNYLRYGSYLSTGYNLAQLFTGNPLGRLFHHFFSPGKGFFLYNPLFVFSLPGLYFFYKKRRKEFLLFLLILALYVSFYVTIESWNVFAFGSRFMVPLIPLFVISLGFFFERFGNRGCMRNVFIFLFILSTFIEIAGLTVSPSRHYYKMRIKYGQEGMAPIIAHNFKEGLLVGQIFEVGEVLKNTIDKNKLQEMTGLALKRKSFLGEDDCFILKYGLTLNVPNFWWFYLYLYGFPPGIILFIIIVLISVIFICSFNLYRWTTASSPQGRRLE